MSQSLFDAETVELTVRPPADREDWFIIVAFWSSGNYWKMFKDTYTSAESAKNAANKLHRGYTHTRIVKITGESRQ